MESSVTIYEIRGDDAALAAALNEARLPVDDLTLPGRRFFRFQDNGRLIGFVGCEQLGESAGLLRSLVVAPAERGNGWGKTIADWMLRRLADLEVTDAWMITTTAEDLGSRLGFSRVDRAAAPEAIRRTRQFADLCPSSAALLHKSLG